MKFRRCQQRGCCRWKVCLSCVCCKSNQFLIRYMNCEDNSNAEGAVGYDRTAPVTERSYENIYEAIGDDPVDGNGEATENENIYESIDDIPRVRLTRNSISAQHVSSGGLDPALISQGIPGPSVDASVSGISDQPGCSGTYGRLGNTYGRIDVLGHGIGRIERHLSSSCGSGIDSNHYAIENLYFGSNDTTGKISKVSVQWLLVNKWLPLWIANTDHGHDYRIIDFLLGQRGDYDRGLESNDDEGEEEGRVVNKVQPSSSPPPPPPPPPPPLPPLQ